MELMTEREKSKYHGFWSPYDFQYAIKPLEVGDMVMLETAEGVEVTEIHEVRRIEAMMDLPNSIEEFLWDAQGHVLPRRQIIAYKRHVGGHLV